MDPKQLKELQEALLKELKTLEFLKKEEAETIVKELLEKASEENKTSMEDIKEEVKKLKTSLEKKGVSEITEEVKQNAVVEMFKAVSKAGNISETDFKKVAETSIKAIDGLNTIEEWKGKELIFDQFQKDIIKVMNEFEVVKNLNFITLKQGDKITLPKVSNGITTAYVEQGQKWDTSAVEFKNITLDVNKTFSAVNITEEMADNMTSQDIYNLIIEMIWESQAEFLENEVLNGKTKITWISNLAGAKVERTKTNSITSIDDDLIIDVETAIKTKFKRNGKVAFLMNEYVLWQLRKLRTTDGARLYPDLRGKNPSIDGYPIILSDLAWEIKAKADDGADKVVMLFWNLKYFQMVRRKELSVSKGYVSDGFLKWIDTIKANQRFGGGATFEEAFVIVKTKAS